MANPSPIPTPDYSGLQTPDYSGLQTIDDPGLEVDAKRGVLHCAYPEVNTAPYPYKVPEPAVDEMAKYPYVDSTGPLAPPPVRLGGFSRRCKIFTLVGIAVVVVIAVVVGCVVGLVVIPGSKSSSTDTSSTGGSSHNQNGTNSSSPPNNTTTIRSTCRDTMCPQILAATQHDTQLTVFARGTDNNIWYNTAATASLSPNWPSSSRWQSLAGGPFLSQPAAVTWQPANSSLRVSVSAVGDPDRGARVRQLDTSTGTWNEWKNLRGSVTSPVSLCHVNDTRLDLWAASGGTVAHNFYRRGTADLYWTPDSSPDWQGSANFPGKISERPGIACRRDAIQHDILVYGSDSEMVHSRYSNQGGWTKPFVLDGPVGIKFQGEPVMLATANDRVDFFGIGDDRAVYHAFWSGTTGYSLLKSLGGKFQSVPSAVATTLGRIDLVALGTTDTVHHRVYQGGQWSDDWEDLGVFGNSAPLAVNLTTTPESVAVFVLGPEGELNQTVWTISTDRSWRDLKWRGMGGDLTPGYFK